MEARCLVHVVKVCPCLRCAEKPHPVGTHFDLPDHRVGHPVGGERIGQGTPEQRRAIVEAIIPREAPYGITISPDGELSICAVLPVLSQGGAQGRGTTGAKVVSSTLISG